MLSTSDFCAARRAIRVVMASTVIAAVVVISGCGSSSSSSDTPGTTKTPTLVNTNNVARAIEHSIFHQRRIHAHVTCPQAILQKKGQDFVCVATSKLGKTKFAVTQQNDSGYVTYAAAK